MGAIFLSYARPDRASAEIITRVLEGAGHDVWWDGRIDGGSEFAAEIERALNDAELVIVAWSTSSVQSRWVRDEAAVGGDKGQLIPVMVEQCQTPMGFRQFQVIDLVGWKGGKRDRRTAELLRAVDQRLNAVGAAEVGAVPPVQPAKAARVATPRDRKPMWAGIAALALLIAAAGYFLWQRIGGQAPSAKATFALAPFDSPSTDSEMRTLASQSRDSMAHAMSQSGIPVRLLSARPSNGSATGDYLISAEFSRNAGKLSATIRVDETARGVSIYSRQFEASGADVQNLPERIAAQMASTLSWAGPQMVLGMRGRADPEIISELMRQNDFTEDGLQGYQNALRIADKYPNSAFGQISVAFDTGFQLGGIPREERAAAIARARRAAERAKVLAPGFGDTYAAWCFLHDDTRQVECEDQLRAGKRIDPDAPFLNSFLSRLRREVGGFDEAVELARLSYAHDPYVPTKIGWQLQMLEFLGDSEGARGLYNQGVRWWPDFKESYVKNRLAGLLEKGDFEAGRKVELEVGEANLPAGYADSSSAILAALKSKSAAAAEPGCTAAKAFLGKVRCMLVFATVGAQDRAYAIADGLYPARIGRTPAETERIWLNDPDALAPTEFITSPGAAPLRGDPRYLELARRVGLLAYWRSGRPPDFCRKQPEPICAQLLKR